MVAFVLAWRYRVTDELQMLDELLEDESDRMTPWEVEFIESLNKQRNRDFSERQVATLGKIWNKVFG